MNNDKLFKFIKDKKFDELFEYIKQNNDIDLDIYDENYNYFIQYLVLYNEYDLIKYILENENMNIRLDILDSDGRSILYNPIKYNYFPLLEILIEYDKKKIGIDILDIKDKSNYNAIHYAIIYDNLKALLLLYKYQYKETNITIDIYELCFEYNRTNILLYLLENEIIKKNDIDNFVNSNGESILRIAINNNNTKVIQYIINNSDFLQQIINIKEHEYGLTVLHLCIGLDYYDVFIKILENKNIDVNLADNFGNTPLHYTIIDKRLKMTEHLMNYKINYNATNINGDTALHLFLEEDINNNKVLLKLLENTNLNIINNKRTTPLHYIIINDLYINDDVKEILTNGTTHLNLFIKTKDSKYILDLVKSSNKEDLINIAIDSYYNILKNIKNKDLEGWEKYCATDDLNSLLKELKKNNKDKDVRYYCKEQIKKLIIDKKQSIPTYKELNLNLDAGIYMEGCYYTGSKIDILFGLLYLNTTINCSLLLEYPLTNNKDIENHYMKMGLNYNFKIDFSNIEIIWSYMKLLYPTNFESILKNKIKNASFIVIPLGIEINNNLQGSAHANIIIIDVNNKIIERFEPNGKNPPNGFYYNPNLLNKSLLNKFSSILPDYKYIAPDDYLPTIGFQMYETIEEHKCKKIGDPNGFCAIWCIWWVEQRINNSDVDLLILADELIKKIKFSNRSFKKIIRNYSMNIVNLRDNYLKKYEINIDDWMNGDYDEDILYNLEKDILDKII